jgi:hypothetical protein
MDSAPGLELEINGSSEAFGARGRNVETVELHMPWTPFKGERLISGYAKILALRFISIFPSLSWSWWRVELSKFVVLIL